MEAIKRTTLVEEVTCPNCWERFPPERVRYVSSHPEQYGDLRLGDEALRRFLPSQFHPDGRAIDPKGGLCHQTACPRCHLSVPRVLLERPTLFVSIFGSPSSGKSYLLAAMTHRMRNVLPREFALNFSDADPEANAILHAYEDKLFSGDGKEKLVSLDKTGETGNWYQEVSFGVKSISYPKPFFFQISPVEGHPNSTDSSSVSRTLCLYDNAGESFQPGADRPDNPVTQHMAKSGCLIFVFDPTQDVSFRRLLSGVSADQQMTADRVDRQELVLSEAARRVKTYSGIPMTASHDRPLIVLISKFDAWQKLVGDQRLANPWAWHPSKKFSVLKIEPILQVSAKLRELLRAHSPSIVATAESFVDPKKVIYMPVSATGGAPTVMPDGRLAHISGSLKPMWVETPLLFVLSQFVPGLVPWTKPLPKMPEHTSFDGLDEDKIL